MEFTNNPRNPNPRPSGATPGRPLERRVFNDFVSRPSRPMPQPGMQRPVPQPAPKPHVTQPAHVPATPAAQRVPVAVPHHQTHPQQQRPTPSNEPPRPASTTQSSALRPADLPRVPFSDPAHDEKMHKPNHHNTHAGMVGFICFVIIGGLLLSPLVPGKILDNFPGSSQTESSGEQTLACATELKNAATKTAYTLKLGSPIVYKYTRVTTETATCDNMRQSADIGRSSQFNPLGLIANLLLAVLVSAGVAKLWHMVVMRRQ